MNENDSDVDDVVSVDNDMSADDVGDSTMEVDHVVPVDGAKKTNVSYKSCETQQKDTLSFSV